MGHLSWKKRLWRKSVLAGDSTHLLSAARGKYHFMRQEEEEEKGSHECGTEKKMVNEDGGDGMKGVVNMYCTTGRDFPKSNLL